MAPRTRSTPVELELPGSSSQDAQLVPESQTLPAPSNLQTEVTDQEDLISQLRAEEERLERQLEYERLQRSVAAKRAELGRARSSGNPPTEAEHTTTATTVRASSFGAKPKPPHYNGGGTGALRAFVFDVEQCFKVAQSDNTLLREADRVDFAARCVSGAPKTRLLNYVAG